MRVIAVIDADFETSPIGTRARLGTLLAGEPVLRRTARRVLAARRLAGVHCMVPATQAPAARDLLAGLPITVATYDIGPVPWRRYVASCRKWSLDAWRGGLCGTTIFDESLHPWVVEAITRREGADAAAVVPAAAALIDPGLLDAMLAHYEKVREQVRLTFTQSAPGLSAAIYSAPLLAELAKAEQLIGRVMAYRPSDPQREMNLQPCFYPVENAIACAAGRCLADTAAGFERISRIIADCGEQVDAATASTWLTAHQLEAVEHPEEVEVELTTTDPLPDTTLRPRGANVPARGPMPEALFERIMQEAGQRDDVRIVLGGFGDPLQHPQWARCVQFARQANVFALAIRTPGVGLDAAAIQQLVAAPVDVVNVLLDAHTPQMYTEVHGADRFEEVMAGVEALLQAARQREHGGVPLVVPEMIKTRRTMGEMEAFYDAWLTRGCTPVIAGPSDYAGRRPDLAVMDMSPPTRTPCRRLFRRCMVLADGTVTLCDQDVDAIQVIGHLERNTLGEIWRGARIGEARAAHLHGQWDAVNLCARCREWHRP